MTNSSSYGRSIAIGAAVAALVLVASVPVAGDTVGARFIASLRMAKPKPVTSPSVAAAAVGRQLQHVVLGILAETTAVAVDEPEVAAPSIDSATRAAGFTPRLVRARTDVPSLSVVGAQGEDARVNRDQLRTLLVESGRRSAVVSPALDGAPVALTIPRGVRAQYGNCPAPIANTIQNQINGPPSPSVDNGSCVVLTETPFATSSTPASLDTSAVLEIALELTGMSPNQVRDFRQLFDWRSAVLLSPPRFMRSYSIVNIGKTRGMLVITGGRRGPTYALEWVDAGIVFTLTGYGSSAEAVPLANSVS